MTKEKDAALLLLIAAGIIASITCGILLILYSTNSMIGAYSPSFIILSRILILIVLISGVNGTLKIVYNISSKRRRRHQRQQRQANKVKVRCVDRDTGNEYIFALDKDNSLPDKIVHISDIPHKTAESIEVHYD